MKQPSLKARSAIFHKGVSTLSPFEKPLITLSKETLKKREIPDSLREGKQTNLKEESLVKYLLAYRAKSQMALIRKEMVKYAEEHGVRAAAKQYECHPNTVSKFLNRFKKEGEQGLLNRSRAPHHIPHKVEDPALIERICVLRDETGYGAERLMRQYELPLSNMPIHRVLKEHGKIQPRKKAWKHKKDLWYIKQHYKTLETKLQLDGKVLTDIPHYYPYYVEFHLPKWEFTLRCVKSGSTFVSYMRQEKGEEACVFMIYVFEHFKRHGIDVSKLTIQIDAASYAYNFRSLKKTAFHKLIESYGAKLRIVPGGKTKQSDVESFHNTIEQEFYARQSFVSQVDFYAKAYRYLYHYNFVRLNRHKGWKPPLYFLNQDLPHIPAEILDLPPIYLDAHADLYFSKLDPTHVPFNEIKLLDIPPHELPTDFSPDEYLDDFVHRVYTLTNNLPFSSTHDVPIHPRKLNKVKWIA